MDNIKPTSSVTDEGIWLTESSAMLFMSKVYRELDGTYYKVNGLNDHALDILFTDDCIQIGEKIQINGICLILIPLLRHLIDGEIDIPLFVGLILH